MQAQKIFLKAQLSPTTERQHVFSRFCLFLEQNLLKYHLYRTFLPVCYMHVEIKAEILFVTTEKLERKI